MNDMPDLPDNVISISMRDYHISVNTLRYTFNQTFLFQLGQILYQILKITQRILLWLQTI